jgi:hypothetical protein
MDFYIKTIRSSATLDGSRDRTTLSYIFCIAVGLTIVIYDIQVCYIDIVRT